MGLFKRVVTRVADKVEDVIVGKDERKTQKDIGSVEDALKKAAPKPKKKPQGGAS